MDQRIKNLADILVNYSIKVNSGDWVVVTSDVQAIPLFNEVVAQVLRAGGHPTLLLQDDVSEAISLRFASEAQLQWIDPLSKVISEQADALISIGAPNNTRAFSDVPAAKQKIRAAARQDLVKVFSQRAMTKELRWVLTQFPCPALAQEANMSLRDYEDFVFRATFADQADPVAAWQKLHDEQQRFIEWITGKDQVIVRGPNVDLQLSINGRTFINADGMSNMPSGEIYTGPVEESVNGWIKFAYPAIAYGREVEGVELEFKNGKVVSAKAKKNEEFLLTMLETDAGARYLGEFAIGTNYGIQQFTKSILYDEKIGGTIHVALGNGYPETGSVNESGIHWDMICDMHEDSEIMVDGELLYKDGKFQI